MNTGTNNRWTLCLLAAVALGACDERASTPSARLQVQVLPLALPGIGNAKYTITVKNAVPELVWEKTVTADQFGDSAGAVSYVGPCDASEPMHTVTLTLDELWDTDSKLLVSPDDYMNPGPVTLVDVECRENADVPVVFNLAIMRSAVQGFFDITVDFKDVFCSAKVDCKDALLLDGAVRGPTVVMAFACTSGTGATGAEPTWLYLSDATITCDGAGGQTQTVELDEITSLGNQGEAGPYLFDWAVYRGREALPGIDKCYWNHAFGLDLTAIGNRTCHLSATGTASDLALTGNAIANDVVWPIVHFEVDVVENGVLCGNNPLDTGTTGVTTSYLTPTTTPRPAAFAAPYQCGSVDPDPDDPDDPDPSFACTGTDAAFRPTSIAGQPAVEVTVGGQTASFTLPAGAELNESCCLANCCAATPPSAPPQVGSTTPTNGASLASERWSDPIAINFDQSLLASSATDTSVHLYVTEFANLVSGTIDATRHHIAKRLGGQAWPYLVDELVIATSLSHPNQFFRVLSVNGDALQLATLAAPGVAVEFGVTGSDIIQVYNPTALAASVTASGATITVDPAADLLTGQHYFVLVDSGANGVKSALDVPLAAPHSFHFYTQ